VSSKHRHLSLYPSFRSLFHNWWPVALWLVVIRLESTDYASSTTTLGLLYRITVAIFGPINPTFLLTVNAILRKSGHFIGYGILSWLVFLALKYTHRDRLQPLLQRRWGTFFRDLWQLDWATIAVVFTLVTATFDELHQAFLPSRSGAWQDVLLDTAGGVIAQLLLYSRASHAMSLQRRQTLEDLEVSAVGRKEA
jgi:VanZ family protein